MYVVSEGVAMTTANLLDDFIAEREDHARIQDLDVDTLNLLLWLGYGIYAKLAVAIRPHRE
jgi:hypothetical protein